MRMRLRVLVIKFFILSFFLLLDLALADLKDVSSLKLLNPSREAHTPTSKLGKQLSNEWLFFEGSWALCESSGSKSRLYKKIKSRLENSNSLLTTTLSVFSFSFLEICRIISQTSPISRARSWGVKLFLRRTSGLRLRRTCYRILLRCGRLTCTQAMASGWMAGSRVGVGPRVTTGASSNWDWLPRGSTP